MITRAAATVTRGDGGRRALVPKLARSGIDAKVDFPQPILIKKGEAATYNAVFAAPEETAAYTDILRPVRDAWNAHLNATLTAEELALPNVNEVRAQHAPVAWETFKNQQVVLTAFDQMLQRYFWTAGNYTVLVEVYAYKGSRALACYTNGFTLTGDNVTLLRGNQFKTLALTCDRPVAVVGDYQWANLEYRNPVV